MKSTLSVLVVVGVLTTNTLAAQKEKSGADRKTNLYSWENVGEIIQISGKTFSIRRTLKISDSSWSLESGAIAEAAQLQTGDQILAKGKTQPDGTFETRRIYMIAPSASRRQVEGGPARAQGADHGGPESKYPRGLGYPGDVRLEGRGRYPGSENRVPVPGTPGGGSKGSPGGMQNSRSSRFPRFNAGDAEGIIEQVGSNSLTLSQTFFIDKETSILQANGQAGKSNALKVGSRVAVTVKDEMDSHRQAIKARVIRLLP